MGGGASVAKREELPKYLQTLRKGQSPKLLKTLVLVEALSSANENKEYLCGPSLGLISELCDILNRDFGDARDAALRIINNLSSQPNNNAELLDSSHGLVVLLSKILASAPGPSKVIAFTILLNLGSGPHAASTLLNPLQGLLPAIIDVLAIDDKELSKYCISLMGVLFMPKEGAASIGAVGAQLLPSLTHILLHRRGSLHSKTVNVVKRLLETCVADTRVVASSPDLGLLNALLMVTNDRNNESNHGKALQAMKFILSEEASVLNVAVTGNGLISGVAKLLTVETTATDAMSVVDAVLAVKSSVSRHYLALADSGIGAALSELLGNKLAPLSQKIWAISCLRVLLSIDDNRKLLGAEKLSLIPLLVSYVRSNTPELMQDGLVCLTLFAVEQTLIPQMVVPKYRLLPTIADIIKSDKGELRCAALGFLKYVAVVPTVREEICSYQLGIMSTIGLLLQEQSGEAVHLALLLLYFISEAVEDQVWFSAAELNILPQLVAMTGVDSRKSPEMKDNKKIAHFIIKNMSKTPENRQYMASPKVGLIPVLIQKCKANGKKMTEFAVETLSNIVEDCGIVCEAFSTYEFYPFLIDLIRNNEISPKYWSAESVESVGLSMLMNVCQWPQSHAPLLRMADTLPALSLIAAGEADIQAIKAVLTLALLIGSSEEKTHEEILKSNNICLRTMGTVLVNHTRSSRNLTAAPIFPMKLTLRALSMLSIADCNKSIILASPKLVNDLCGSIREFVNTSASAKFSFDYEIAKRVAESILYVLLGITLAFPSSTALLASDSFEEPTGLLESLDLIKGTDMHPVSKQTAAMLAWRLRNSMVDEDESVSRNFIAIIYSWPPSQTSRPELLECFAISLQSMNFNVIMIEDGNCRNVQEGPSSWNLPPDKAFPDTILARCSAAVIALSSGLSDSPNSSLMVQTAKAMEASGDLAIEYVCLESDFPLMKLDKKEGMKCCSMWLKSAIGKSKIRSLWALSNVEPASNKIGEAFDGIKQLRGAAVPIKRKNKKPAVYSKKEPRGNERRFDIAWGILQTPHKAKQKEELQNLIASIGVYNSKDLQLCDFDDLMCMSKLLKKLQMRNFNELLFDVVVDSA